MSPFRLFGPAPDPHVAATDPEPDVAWAPGPWTSTPGDGESGTATRHARPVAFGRGPGLVGVDDDPLTDPHGFPPVPSAVRPTPVRSSSPPVLPDAPVDGPLRHPAWPVHPVAPPDPLEAAALAGAFAADYLSWDEDDPGRRGQALANHVAPVADPALLGWDGRGRQRAEFALPGLVRPDGDDRVLVDVRVRVTPYREVGRAGDRAADRLADAAEGAEPEPEVPGVPAAAPAPTGRGWRGCASYWVRLSVPVVREDGRLVVDAADEAPDPSGYPDEPGDRNSDRSALDRSALDRSALDRSSPLDRGAESIGPLDRSDALDRSGPLDRSAERVGPVDRSDRDDDRDRWGYRDDEPTVVRRLPGRPDVDEQPQPVTSSTPESAW